VQAALEHGVVCGDQAHDHAHQHLHTQGVGTVALRAEAPMDLQRLTTWLLSLSTRTSHELMRLKGIVQCQSQAQAVVIQGVYQWLEVRRQAGQPPAASAMVLIGRHLDAEALRRGWAECIARP
jgi:G3E family GTPase